ncbi:MAG TPA: Flp family type IVb pilin [Candidatus Dormibacteraeota bacterium]|jgi:pilus assembly protein Flp/PilA|nr:Flp family type IVb pilin [Candidatus Dormibacteraeota bacterium]
MWGKYPSPRWLARRDGQSMVEYALILVLVAIVVIGILTTLGTKLQGVFNEIVNSLK